MDCDYFVSDLKIQMFHRNTSVDVYLCFMKYLYRTKAYKWLRLVIYDYLTIERFISRGLDKIIFLH
jgi:hypothetical protein